jgi:peptide/nickel transport system permease protein
MRDASTLDGDRMNAMRQASGDIDLAASQQHTRATSQLRIALRRARRSPHAVAGALILITLAALAVFAPVFASANPYAIAVHDRFQAPSLTHHPFGTDELGRDVFSRVLYGGRISLRVGVLATLLALSAGTLLGLSSGYFGGAFDFVSQRLLEMMMTFPGLILALGVIAILGPGLENVLLALAVGGVPYYARLVRGQVLSLRAHDYVEAARVLGAGHTRILLRHILPGTASPLIVVASLDLANNILAVSGLSFIGLGAAPATPEWGAMLAAGRVYMRQHWWLTTFPGLAIVAAVLGLNLLGDGLRDVLDPHGGR